MVKRTVQCSCQTQLNVQIRIFKRDFNPTAFSPLGGPLCPHKKKKKKKETIAVFISNETSDNEMSFEIKHTVKHKFLAQIGKIFSILSVKPVYPNAY